MCSSCAWSGCVENRCSETTWDLSLAQTCVLSRPGRVVPTRMWRQHPRSWSKPGCPSCHGSWKESGWSCTRTRQQTPCVTFAERVLVEGTRLTSRQRERVLLLGSVNTDESNKEMFAAMDKELLSKIIKGCVFRLN